MVGIKFTNTITLESEEERKRIVDRFTSVKVDETLKQQKREQLNINKPNLIIIESDNGKD